VNEEDAGHGMADTTYVVHLAKVLRAKHLGRDRKRQLNPHLLK